MFMGRPPRITSRYCAFEGFPLELHNEELALESAELIEVIKTKLNDKGERLVRDVTLTSLRHRENYSMLLQREAILELCLSNSRDHATHARAQELVQQSQELWGKRRQYFQHHPSTWAGRRPTTENYVVLQAWLGHRYNDFLLQRLLVQRFDADPEELLFTADELLSNTLFMVSEDSDADVDWTLSLYSLPAAGVLALELIKQQTQPDYRSPARAPPRSRVIQNLSVLIAALNWISREGVGNYALGRQAKATLERVLERVLNADNIPARIVQTVRQQELGPANSDSERVTHPKSTHAPGHNKDPTQGGAAHAGSALPTPASSNDIVADDRGLWDEFPWQGQFDIDQAFWQGLEEHPILDARVLGFNGALDVY